VCELQHPREWMVGHRPRGGNGRPKGFGRNGRSRCGGASLLSMNALESRNSSTERQQERHTCAKPSWEHDTVLRAAIPERPHHNIWRSRSQPNRQPGEAPARPKSLLVQPIHCRPSEEPAHASKSADTWGTGRRRATPSPAGERGWLRVVLFRPDSPPG
jgi:hypothetical protein